MPITSSSSRSKMIGKKKMKLKCSVFGTMRWIAAASVAVCMATLLSLRSEMRPLPDDKVPTVPAGKRAPFEARSAMSDDVQQKQQHPNTTSTTTTTSTSVLPLPAAFQSVLERARYFRSRCEHLASQSQTTTETRNLNITLEADLPPFGIIDALESYRPSLVENDDDEQEYWQCELPPATECNVTKFTVILLGYSSNRVVTMGQNIRKMLNGAMYRGMVEEIVLVWNNPSPLENVHPAMGTKLMEWHASPTNPFDTSQKPNPFRICFPLEEHDVASGSDLLNRYHPMIRPKSKAILYYDDDGPFYGDQPIASAFELWRRNADAQLGAMPRAFVLSARQQEERRHILGKGDLKDDDDRKFVSHCRSQNKHGGDVLEYDFRYFTPFHANMVLPSGSFLHRNYLCFIWHPALKAMRQFVQQHPVHPDDVTVSTLVSQLSGRSPLTYSRRLPKEESKRRLLQTQQQDNDAIALDMTTNHRRLLWDDVDEKVWSNHRSSAVNSLVGFYGSVTSGSLGWCYKTKFHKQKGDRQVCDPEIARLGMLPWMQPGGFRNDICPLLDEMIQGSNSK